MTILGERAQTSPVSVGGTDSNVSGSTRTSWTEGNTVPAEWWRVGPAYGQLVRQTADSVIPQAWRRRAWGNISGMRGRRDGESGAAAEYTSRTLWVKLNDSLGWRDKVRRIGGTM